MFKAEFLNFKQVFVLLQEEAFTLTEFLNAWSQSLHPEELYRIRVWQRSWWRTGTVCNCGRDLFKISLCRQSKKRSGRLGDLNIRLRNEAYLTQNQTPNRKVRTVLPALQEVKVLLDWWHGSSTSTRQKIWLLFRLYIYIFIYYSYERCIL